MFNFNFEILDLKGRYAHSIKYAALLGFSFNSHSKYDRYQ